MDETQHFCLRWNNYQSSITSAFENLRDDEDFVDVTLACEGRSIKAHRVVLSACSPYFRDLLKSTPCKHPVILLQDVNFLDLHSLVEFIYHGEVNVHQKSLQSFLKTAEVLRVSGLTQQQAEETHSQLAQIQNLANAANATRTPLNSHHTLLDEPPLYPRNSGSPPPPPPSQQLPLASTHINSQLFKRSMAMLRRERNNSTPSAEDSNNAMKRLRGPDNGLPSSNNNSPEIVHQRSASPQLTPADFSTIKHNNNNTPPLKEDKRNGPSGNNGNSGNGNSDTGNGNGIANNDKVGSSLTSSPLTRTVDDVKSEPMELVCSNNNPTVVDEHSNDSTGEHEANRSSSGDGGKGSLSSGNDEEIDNNMPTHPPPPYLMSPAESKLFSPAAFNFPMSGLDPATLAGFNSQLQSAAEISVSPQGGSTNLLGGVIIPGGSPNTSSSSNQKLQHEHLHHSTTTTTTTTTATTSSAHQFHHHHHQQQQHHQHLHHHHQQPEASSPHHQQQLLPQHLRGDRDSDRSNTDCSPHSPIHRMPKRPASEQPHHTQSHLSTASSPSDVIASTPPPLPAPQHMKPPSPHHSHQHPHFGHQQLPLGMLPSHHLHAHHELSASSHHHHHLSRTGSPLDHHHLLHHRRSSLSPSPTGRGSGGSAAGILSSTRGGDMVGGSSRLLLPLPLNACHRCDVCGKLLSTKLTLKRHKEQQHLQPLNNAVCNLCHKVFRTLNSLNNHKSIYHRRQKNHHSYFHHSAVGGGVSGSPSSRLHQSLSSLSAAAVANNSVGAGGNGNAVAAAAAAAAAAAELLLSPIVGAAAVAGGGSAGPGVQISHGGQQQSSPNMVKPCMDFL